MKLTGYFTAAIVAVAMISCQKSYNPPDLVLDSSRNGGGGGGTSSGSLLIKAETKVAGSKEASSETYEYDASNKIIRVISTETDSTGKTGTYYYRYQRDASGRVTRIVTDVLAAGAPGAGYPDSVVYTVHYPSSTAPFDYTGYSFSVSGIVFKDSTTYVYNSSGAITDTYDYQSVAGQPMALTARMQFLYSGGNIINLKVYDPSNPATPAGTYNFEFDGKPSAISIGNDAFLPGLDPGYVSVNNITRNTMSAATYNEVLQYAYQYNNTTQQPVSATITQASTKKTYNLTFTYK